MRSSACARSAANLLLSVMLAACGGSSTGARADASTAKATFTVDLAPARKLDMVFMIGRACCTSLAEMNEQLPNLMEQLRYPADKSLPDLRIAMITSDLGTGGQYASGPCGPNPGNGQNPWGDSGRFQMRGAASCGVSADALWLEYANGEPVNYHASEDISTVFACLSSNLGNDVLNPGCGYQHSLQAFEFALVTPNIGNEQQRAMIRPYAQLALVLLTDQDDCSAAPNDGMLAGLPGLDGEAATLRCATRGHECGGVNLTVAPPGYPTTTAFSAPFASCKARTDACPNATDGTAADVVDTSGPTDCSPLKSVKFMADELKALKPFPDHQLLAAGVFGWPRNEAEMATATYRIDLVPSPDPAHPEVFEHWPACYHPNHPPPSDGSFSSDAWGMAAQGGLRLAAFLDQFGRSGLKFSICEPDFSVAMTTIGQTLARRLQGGCISAAVGAYARCTAHLQIPDGLGGYLPQANPVPSCAVDPSATPCYALAPDAVCGSDEVKVQVIPATSVVMSTVLRFDCE
jgi:hypothetical protein